LNNGLYINTLLSYLISKRSKDSVDRGEVGRGGGLGLESDLGLLLGVVSLLLDLSLSLELGDEVSVAPSDLLGQLAQDGEVAVSAESQTLEGGGNHHTLLLVVRLGDALEGLKKQRNTKTHQKLEIQVILKARETYGKTAERQLTLDGLVGKHAAELLEKRETMCIDDKKNVETGRNNDTQMDTSATKGKTTNHGQFE